MSNFIKLELSSIKKNKQIFAYILFCIPFLIAFILATRGIVVLPPAISLWAFQLRIYSICMLAGIGFASWIGASRVKNYQQLKNLKIDELIIALVIPGLIGARVFYVIEFWDYYQASPQEILAVWNGGLSIYGALAGGLIALILFTHWTKINFIMLLDLIVMHIPLGQILGRFGNFANQEHYGPETNLPWGILINSTGKYHHPAFLYEQIGNLILYFVLVKIYQKDKLKTPALMTISYLTGYGIIRFLVDLFRVDARVGAGLTVAQFISIVFIILGIMFILSKFSKYKWQKS